ncbi:MAG TPA: hypothetical protein VE999_01225 [Gemmataceae bacterium]|nr:hypothetical protein [Gemmataceae bacterium]
MGARWVFGVTLVFLVGCGSPSARLEEAKEYVQQALEVWKKGGKPDELNSLTPPIDFHEAMWNAGEKLVSFEVGAVRYIDKAKVVRCETRLTVRNRKGKERTEAVVYDVTLGSPVKIVNNPMP